MTRLVIFDCDGVLVDSERLAIQVDVEYLSGIGWQLTEAEAIEDSVPGVVPPGLLAAPR